MVRMRLYLVQHGDAVAKDVDPERPLSDRGRMDIGRLARWLASIDARPARILHSGKLRAEQTANLLAPLAGDEGTVEACPGLAPNEPPDAFLETLVDGDTIVAGHMPFVSRAVSVALDLPPERAIVAFKPGSVAVLERDADGKWQLVLFIRPEQV